MEARLEEGQKYSPFWGIANQFEMVYVVGSERDMNDISKKFITDEMRPFF